MLGATETSAPAEEGGTTSTGAVLGATESREAPQGAVLAAADTGSTRSSLPFTGLDAWLIGGAGLVLLLGGLIGRRAATQRD